VDVLSRSQCRCPRHQQSSETTTTSTSSCRPRAGSSAAAAAGRRVDHVLVPLLLLLVVVEMLVLEPGAVPLQCVEDVLTVRVDQLRPGLPQRLHDEVDEPDLKQRNAPHDHNTIQYNTIQYNTIQYNTIYRSLFTNL